LARVVAGFRFNLDDVGAEIAQRLRRVRSEYDGGNVDHRTPTNGPVTRPD